MRERGAILIVTLALSCVIALVCAALLRSTAHHVQGVRAEIEHVRAFHAADAALAVCEQAVLEALTGRVTERRAVAGLRVDVDGWPDSSTPPRCGISWVEPSQAWPAMYRVDSISDSDGGVARACARLDMWVIRGTLKTMWSTPATPPAYLLRPSAQGRRSALPRRRVKRAVRASGMTLLEALCALAIAGVVASYAVPTYRDRAASAHRMAATLALHRAAQYVELRRLEVAAAGTARDPFLVRGGMEGGEGAGLNGTDDLPAELARVPAPPAAAVYRVELRNSAEHDAYRIEAIPVHDGPMSHDACGVLTLDASGLLSHSGSRSNAACRTGRE
jgi:type IV pilus assembly protein PilE